ncbi:MAG: PAS domain-containing protein, partial [Bryobacteraceae bacterium]
MISECIGQAPIASIEECYRALLDGAQDVVFTTDLEGNFTRVNPAFEQVLGYREHESLRLNLEGLLTHESWMLMQRMIRKALAGTPPPDFDARVIASDGREMFMKARCRLVRNAGTPAGLSCLLRDNTDRLLVERALQNSVERYDLATRGSKDGIWEWDFAGGAAWVSTG